MSGQQRGPRLNSMRLSRERRMKRRVLKIQRHDVKGARPIFWCGGCEKFTYNLRTHLCGERQNWDAGL